MFQLPTWPAGNRRATSVAALEAAVNAAIGAGGGAESVLIVQHAGDATAEITARLESMAEAGGGTLRVRRGRIGDPVRLDARVQLRGDDCTLVFDSPIVMGPTGSLRIKGDLDKYWRGAVASLGSLASRSWLNHRLSVDSPMPRSPAISRRVRPLVSASRTASRRNSGVGLFPFPIEHLLVPQLVLSIFSGQVHSVCGVQPIFAAIYITACQRDRRF